MENNSELSIQKRIVFRIHYLAALFKALCLAFIRLRIQEYNAIFKQFDDLFHHSYSGKYLEEKGDSYKQSKCEEFNERNVF